MTQFVKILIVIASAISTPESNVLLIPEHRYLSPTDGHLLTSGSCTICYRPAGEGIVERRDNKHTR